MRHAERTLAGESSTRRGEHPTRVLFVVEPIALSASTRFRVGRYLPGLRAAGIETRVLPAAVGCRLDRLAGHGELVRRALWSDVIVVQRHLFSGRVFNLLRALGRPIVFDFDDALYAFPTGQAEVPPAAWMEVVRARLRRTLEGSRHVIAGNAELASYARQINPNVSVIPTSVGSDALATPARPPNPVPVLGWIGRSENLAYVKPIAGALAQVQRQHPFILRVVCDRPLEVEGLQVDNRRWSLETEARDLASFDLGISPLADDVWSLGKCGFRTIQMMAAGAPAVVSPVGMHRQLVRDGLNGLWASSAGEWQDRVGRLVRDDGLRGRLGSAAKQTIAREYAIEANLPKLIRVLEQARAEGPRG